MYMTAGDRVDERVARWAAEIADLMRQHSSGNRRIASDRMELPGHHALAARGLQVVDAGPITEIAGSIKSPDEISLMHWTIRVCEAGMARIHEHAVRGATERELWAHLHFENARSGGDWLETKLLTCGNHTNPGIPRAPTASARGARCSPLTPTWSALTGIVRICRAPGLVAPRR